MKTKRKCTMCCKIKNEKWAVCTHIQQKDEKKVEKANLLVQKNYAIMKLLSAGLKKYKK